jgi:alpha/beta superfamily hydrolase
MGQSKAVEIQGPVGRLEGIFQGDPGGEPAWLALVCHPHPLGGGTMHTKVVHRTARALEGAGMHVLRFNFRGVGASQGVHDKGIGEQDDARAALDTLTSLYSGKSVLMAGFSFGSWVGLKVGAADSRVEALIGIAPPANLFDFSFLNESTKPKMFIHGTEDTIAPLGDFESAFRDMSGPKGLVKIRGGDHLLTGHLDEVGRAVSSFALKLIG